MDQMDKPAIGHESAVGPTGAWNRYRAKFITDDNIDKGVAFWREHAATLQRASATYGVPPEIIVGIIGVETRWGRIMGKTRIIDALATLSFDYPRRSSISPASWSLLPVMTRDEGIDPFRRRAPSPGPWAMGSSCRRASASTRWITTATATAPCGTRWTPSAASPITSRATAGAPASRWRCGPRERGRAGPLKAGFDTRYSLATLAASGHHPGERHSGADQVSLLKLDVGSGYEYWLGLHNFYVITRYNHSTYYAMAVYQLGNAVKGTRVGGPPGCRPGRRLQGRSRRTASGPAAEIAGTTSGAAAVPPPYGASSVAAQGQDDLAAMGPGAVLVEVDPLPGPQGATPLASRAGSGPSWSGWRGRGPACRRDPRRVLEAAVAVRDQAGQETTPGPGAPSDRRSRTGSARRWCAGRSSGRGRRGCRRRGPRPRSRR